MFDDNLYLYHKESNFEMCFFSFYSFVQLGFVQ